MVSPQDVSTTRGVEVASTTGSWDPYDVWLTRVKQPRDRQPHRTAAVAEIRAPIAVTDSKANEPLRLRAVT
jgi:hypothetical protein